MRRAGKDGKSYPATKKRDPADAPTPKPAASRRKVDKDKWRGIAMTHLNDLQVALLKIEVDCESQLAAIRSKISAAGS
jgi:hypothetical protein